MGEPTMNIVRMKQCSIIDISTTDHVCVSIIATLRVGRRCKSISQLLGLLKPDVARIRAEWSMAHLLGERAVDLESVNNEEIWDNLCIRLHDYFCETLGLSMSKKVLKWNLHFDLVVTNAEGLVLYRGCCLWWTSNLVRDYLRYAANMRRALNSSGIVNALFFLKH
jgi:hypothetical protein